MSKQAKATNSNENSTDAPEMSRRNFFKRGFTKAVDAGVGVLEQRAVQKARHWIRPPFAKPELVFLLACTRCNACVDACPHQVIFTLPVRRGAEVAATPALDIVNKGCHLCSDWPCVNACGEGAVSFPEENSEENEEDPAMPNAIDCPPMAKATINAALCIPYSGPECGACRSTCPIDNTLTWRGDTPEINQQSCIGCGQCRAACITAPKAIEIQTIELS